MIDRFSIDIYGILETAQVNALEAGEPRLGLPRFISTVLATDCLATRLLRDIGIDLTSLSEQIRALPDEKVDGGGDSVLKLSDQVERLLWDATVRSPHSIGTEHLVLALLNPSTTDMYDGVAAAFEAAGVSFSSVVNALGGPTSWRYEPYESEQRAIAEFSPIGRIVLVPEQSTSFDGVRHQLRLVEIGDSEVLLCSTRLVEQVEAATTAEELFREELRRFNSKEMLKLTDDVGTDYQFSGSRRSIGVTLDRKARKAPSWWLDVRRPAPPKHATRLLATWGGETQALPLSRR